MVIMFINTFSLQLTTKQSVMNSLQSQSHTTHNKINAWKYIKTVTACGTSLTDIPWPLG